MNQGLMNIDSINAKQSIMGISLLGKLVVSMGYDLEGMLNKSGIAMDLLNDPKASISLTQEIAFTRELVNTMTEPDLGFQAGQCYRINAFGHIGLAAGSSDTVEEAITFFLKYIRLAYTHFDIDFFTSAGNAVLRFNDKYNLNDLRRFYLERDFSFAFLSTRDMFPRSIVGQKPKTIHFDFPCPSSVEHYQRLYQCPVHFSMPHNQILFDERYLALALPLANSLTRELLEEQCKSQERALLGPQNYDEKIRGIIQATQAEIPSLNKIAKQYFMTPRTLRRKLKEQGVSFQQLVNEELCKKALHYLSTTTLTVEQISIQLGYSESASFIHAFKRWTGKTPKTYR